MKKTILSILALLIAFYTNSQNLKPIPQKINDKKAGQAVFTPVQLFDVTSSSQQRAAELVNVVNNATVMEFRQADAQKIVNTSPENLHFIVPTSSGISVELELYRSSIFTPDFTVVTSSNDQAVSYSGGVHYWGIIKGDNNSTAAISIYNDKVMGMISSTQGNIVLGKLDNDVAGRHILYNDLDLHSTPLIECATANDNSSYRLEDIQNPNRVLTNCIRLFWEVNYDIYQGQGSVTNAANYVTGLFNQSAIIYANDGIPVELSEIYVWNTTSPYTSSTTSGQLGIFQSTRNSINGDLGHLLGYTGGGGIAAGFSGICASNLDASQCYSMIYSTYSNVPTYSWSVMVVTHEQGHLMGSRHTHACVWNGNNTAIDGCGPAAGYAYEGSCSGAPIPPTGGTIMSYCHLNAVGINFNNGFGTQPKNVILNNFNNATCLSACMGTSCMPSANMSTSNVANTTATFTWDAVTGATGYNIRYRIVGTSTWTTVNSVTSPYNVTGLTAGGNYEWQVQTVCSGGNSIYTISTNFTTIPLTCNTPTNLSTTNISYSSATFNWGAVSGASSYSMRYRIVGTSTWTTVSAVAGATAYNAFSLTSSSNYEWQIQTLCVGGGTSAFSSSVLFTTTVQPCNNPQNLYTSNITSSTATFNWNASSGAVSYSIRYRIVGTSTWTTISTTSTSYNATGLTPGTNYEWQIQTICTGGQASFSSSILFTTCNTTATITAGGPTTFCQGGSVLLTANTGAGLTYQWKKNSLIIVGATASSYTASVSGAYTVVTATSGSCAATSNSIIVTVTTAQQYTWTQKANFGGGTRYGAFAFSIGTKGYAGLGIQWNGAAVYGLVDFWEYDPSNNAWTQKANFPGVSRISPAGFSIGSKGYVTTGWTASTQLNDTWEYDPSTNTWAQKANFAGSARYTACSFTIGNFAYVGTGYSPLQNDFWKYDPSNNAWTQIANVGGIARQSASGFAIGSYGYVFGGGVGSGPYLNHLWKYDPIANSWTQKTSCPSAGKIGSARFTIGNKAYLGVGCDSNTVYQDFYEYDPVTDSWIQIPDLPGGVTQAPISFSAGDKGYVGTGSSGIYPNISLKQDFWELSINCIFQTNINASGPLTFCQGDNVTLSVPNVSCTSYQWKLNNVNIPGATTNSYLTSASGSYSIEVTNSCGSSTSSAANVTVNPLPVVSFSGLASSYAVNASAATLTGSPAGGTFSGPGITGNAFSPSTAGVGGPYTITYSFTDAKGCSNSTSQQTTVVNCAVPAQPGTISVTGGAKVCPGDTRTYKVTKVTGLTYTWVPAAGATIQSGQGTNQVVVNYTANFTSNGIMSVTASNNCGPSAPRTLAITRNIPASPGVISGLLNGVCNLTNQSYSVTNVAGMTYNWSFTVATAVVTGGQGTSAITANYNSGFVSATLKITANNACGASAVRSATIKAAPAVPVAITGTTTPCANQSGVPYSVAPVAFATKYTWTAPTGSHINDGSVTSSGATLTTTSTNVTVNFGANAGNITCKAGNTCAFSSTKNLAITFSCRQAGLPGEVSHGEEIQLFPNPFSESATLLIPGSFELKNAEIRIEDVLGKVVFSRSGINDHIILIERNNMHPGIYFLQLYRQDRVSTTKFVIE